MTPSAQSYREIPLTQGQVALIDIADDKGQKYCATWTKCSQTYYVARGIRVNGKRYLLYLHRELMGLAKGDKRQVDHINGNTLDNRRCNLRIVTPSQNRMNKPMQVNNKSGYRGVYWYTLRGCWIAKIQIQGKITHIGFFDDVLEAAEAYRKAAVHHFGEFSNFEPIPERLKRIEASPHLDENSVGEGSLQICQTPEGAS